MIIYKRQASRAIAEIVYFIEKQGFPQNARNYEIKLFEFAESLQVFPEKYQKCRFEQYLSSGYRCAAFDEYIFIYKIQKNDVILINIVHGKRLV